MILPDEPTDTFASMRPLWPSGIVVATDDIPAVPGACYAPDMLDANQLKRLDEILAELEELQAKDRQFLQYGRDTTEAMLSVPIQDLFSYGERYARREILQKELREMVK